MSGLLLYLVERFKERSSIIGLLAVVTSALHLSLTPELQDYLVNILMASFGFLAFLVKDNK